jgi:hypothetical protein
MPEFKFDDIEVMQRNRDVERDGVEVGLPGDRVLIVRAASDANPLWKAQSEQIGNELRRLNNARAPNDKVRAYLARKFAELLIKDWQGVKSGGVEIPYSIEAGTAFLLAADDAYAAVDEIVWATKNFRGKRIEAIVGEAKN